MSGGAGPKNPVYRASVGRPADIRHLTLNNFQENNLFSQKMAAQFETRLRINRIINDVDFA
jgi:hypothetical protein